MLELKTNLHYSSVAAPADDAVRLVSEILQRNPEPTLCEIGVGIGATSLELCRLLDSRGEIYFFDFEDRIAHLLRDLANAGYSNIKGFGCERKRFNSYNWPLAKLALASRTTQPGGIFDFVYLDGAHVFHHDAPTAVLLKELIKANGVVLFDDCEWTLANAPHLSGNHGPTGWARFLWDYLYIRWSYGTEQISHPHVAMICDLFFDHDPGFERVQVGGTRRRAYRRLTDRHTGLK
jgi:predicted O-methyltransferase YrrM